MAEQRGIPALLECLRLYADDLRYLFEKRHALTHTVGIVEFDEARAFAVVERVVCAVLAARPELMLALLLVEARAMSLAGRRADARRACEAVIAECGRARAAGVGEERVQVCMGHALARLGRAGEAEACCKRAMQINPRYALASLEMGHLMMRAGRPGEAFAMYKRSAAADPGRAAVRVERGHALGLVRGREKGGALTVECDVALLLDSEEMSAHTGCGLALAAMGRHGDAIGWYRRAIKNDPGDAEGRTGLAISLARVGRRAESVAAHGDAIKIFGRPGFAGAAGRGAPAGGAGGPADYDDGSVARDLGFGAACSGLGNELLRAGRAGESIPAFRRAVKLDGRRADAWSGLARALAMAGMDAEAGRARGKAEGALAARGRNPREDGLGM